MPPAATSLVANTTLSSATNPTSGSGTLASQTATANDGVISSSSSSSGLSGRVIAGIVLGVLVGFAIFLLIILWLLRRKHKERDAKAAATAELTATTDEDRRPELGTNEEANRHELHGGSEVKQPIEKDGEALTSTDDSASTMRKEKPHHAPVEMP